MARNAATAGVRSLVAASVSFSLMALFARLAGARLPALELVFVRSLLTLVMTVFLIRRAGIRFRGSAPKRLLVLRGVFGALALTCFFYAVTHMPLAEATVIHFASPISTALIAAVYLRERATPRLFAAISLGLAGVLLIARPAVLFGGATSELAPTAVAVAVTGALLMSVAHVLVRRLAPIEHELVIIFYFPLVTVPASLIAVAPIWIWPNIGECLFLLGLGLGAQGGQIYLTRGMRYMPAGPASVVLYLQILFAGVLGFLVLGERPDVWTVAGSILILGGTVVASRRPAAL